ncbi:DNA-binding protein [Variovorax sp. J22P168]|uniref:DNA-binding protein n=1 Tax=Variovorax jilinensis TaxID=3053513 RepID=UPI002574F680|nr:DNA-binding protein [Variovorax sp. J22P168]MDM0015763.1 DNA-binding protein [Variovorax sp. J22P168]
MDPRSSSANIVPIRSGRGIQEAQVREAADALLQEGLRPTIERVRQKIGSGSPNTVSPMLERWFATLGRRLGGDGRHSAQSSSSGEAHQLPLAIVQAAQQFWTVAQREADQVQIQQTEATRRALELERTDLAHRETELQQRHASFEQARVALDEALTSSRQAVTAMEAQMQAQQLESARLLSASEAEVRRLRKALDEALASKEALREKSAMELQAQQRAASEAEDRHLSHERRLLSDIDRERMAARQVTAELDKAQKKHATHAEDARNALSSVQMALQDAKTAHRDAAAASSLREQAMQVELAALRERAAGAEQRATDLASQIERLETQSEREIASLQASHALANTSLQRLGAQLGGIEKAPRGRKKVER